MPLLNEFIILQDLPCFRFGEVKCRHDFFKLIHGITSFYYDYSIRGIESQVTIWLQAPGQLALVNSNEKKEGGLFPLLLVGKVSLALVLLSIDFVNLYQSRHESGNLLRSSPIQFGNTLSEFATSEMLCGIHFKEHQHSVTQDQIGFLIGSQLFGAGILLVKLNNHVLKLGTDFCFSFGDVSQSGSESNLLSHLSHSINPFWFVGFSFPLMI